MSTMADETDVDLARVLESQKNSEPGKQSRAAEKKNVGPLSTRPTQKRSVVTLNPHPVQKSRESTRSVEERTIPSITGEGTVPAFTVESLSPPESAKESVQTD